VTKRALWLAAFASLVACARPPYVSPAGNGVVVHNARIGVYTKEVVTKKDPDTLMADDATICRVSPDVYRSTRLHTMVQCNWQ